MGLRAEQGHGLAHHVRSHECAVGVVVFQERDERCGDGGDLSGCHVHEFHLIGATMGKSASRRAFTRSLHEVAVVVERALALCNDLAFFDLGGEVYDLVVVEVYL